MNLGEYVNQLLLQTHGRINGDIEKTVLQFNPDSHQRAMFARMRDGGPSPKATPGAEVGRAETGHLTPQAGRTHAVGHFKIGNKELNDGLTPTERAHHRVPTDTFITSNGNKLPSGEMVSKSAYRARNQAKNGDLYHSVSLHDLVHLRLQSAREDRSPEQLRHEASVTHNARIPMGTSIKRETPVPGSYTNVGFEVENALGEQVLDHVHPHYGVVHSYTGTKENLGEVEDVLRHHARAVGQLNLNEYEQGTVSHVLSQLDDRTLNPGGTHRAMQLSMAGLELGEAEGSYAHRSGSDTHGKTGSLMTSGTISDAQYRRMNKGEHITTG